MQVHLHKEKLISDKRSLQRVQDELTEYAIAKYKDEMMKKIDENPELYINVKKNNQSENES